MDKHESNTIDDDAIARMMFGKNIDTIKRAVPSFFKLFGIMASSEKQE